MIFLNSESDPVANSWYAQARNYLSAIGRFVSEDAVKGFSHKPLTLNIYTYCFNKPLDFVDLDGNYGKPQHDLITRIAAQLIGVERSFERDEYGEYIRNDNGNRVEAGVIRILQENNRAVDDLRGGTGFLPGFGSPSYHFDHSRGEGRDTRINHAEEYFREAVIAIRSGDQIGAVELLGRGTHPLQDMHSHGQIGAPSRRSWLNRMLFGHALNYIGHAPHSILPGMLGNPDGFLYDWTDDSQTSLRSVPHRRFSRRLIDAILETEDYLRRFQEVTRFKLKEFEDVNY